MTSEREQKKRKQQAKRQPEESSSCVASEWKTHRLGDIAEIFDGPHATPAKTPHGPVFLGIWNLSNGRLDLSETEHLSEEDWNRWSRRVTPRPGDVVFSYETRLGEAASIPNGLRCCLGRRMGLLRPRNQDVDGGFLLYAYLGPAFQETIRERTVPGSTVDRIPLVELPEFPITLPDLNEQRAISHILSTFDAKIELNRKMNETLEAIARALFKSWFVDFDPVRAKAEGRDSGLPAPIAALFPDSFEDSELGETPCGWNIGRLDDLLLLQRGFDLPSSARTPGQYQVIAASGPNGTHNQYMVRGPGVTTGRSGVLGKVFYIQEDFWPLNTSLWIKEFKLATPTYAFQLLDGLNFYRFNAGSAVPTLNRNHVHDLAMVLPPRALIEAFENHAAVIYECKRAVKMESVTLSELRDALLPKLISGELRIPQAERMVEAHI